MKILKTIRELLKFKDYTTISEIAKYSNLPQSKVLEVINKNERMVWRNRKNGRITKVDPASVLKQDLKNSGVYYIKDTYGAWSVEGECLTILGEPFYPLPDGIFKSQLMGALGDSFYRDIIPLDKKSELEALGYKDFNKVVIDDRLWVE